MFWCIEKKEVRAWIHLLMISCCFLFVCRASLSSQEIMVNDQEEASRLRAAYIIAGIAVIAVGAGIGYAASCSSHGHCHDSYCSYSNYFDSCYSSDYSGRCRYSSYPSSYSSYYSGSWPSSSSSYSRVTNGLLDRDFPLTRHKKLPKSFTLKHSEKERELAGFFTVHPSFTEEAGQATVFVQTPGGCTQTLGSFSLNNRAGNGIAFGPFTESGTYTFGVTIETGNRLATSEKLCTVEIKVDGAIVESHDFISMSGDPIPLHYTL